MTKKLSLVLVVLALFFFQLAVPGSAEVDQKSAKKIEKLIKKTNSYLKKKDIPKAEETLAKAMAISPDYANTHFGYGRLHLMQNKPTEAIDSLLKAIELDDSLVPAKDMAIQVIWKHAGSLYRSRKINDSNTYLAKLIEIPGAVEIKKTIVLGALYQLGLNYTNQRNFTKANGYLAKILEIPGVELEAKDKFVNATYQMGVNCHQAKKFEEATKYFDKIRGLEGIQPQYLKIYNLSTYMLGLSYNQMKKADESNRHMKEYLELTKENANDQFAPLANFIVGSNNFDKLEKEISPLKTDPKIKDRKAQIAKIATTKNEIEPYLTKAVTMNPKLEPAYMQLGNFYYYCGNLEKATEMYQKLVAQFPTSQDIGSYKKFLEDLESQKKK